MKIAFISDIHANLEALQKSLGYIKENGIEKVFCLGDVIGYGPNPNDCVELVREHCEIVLMGNHDYAGIGLANIQYFNEYAKISTYWTREKLTDENILFLKTMPFTYEMENILLVHAAPKSPSNWDYVLSVQDAQKQLKAFKQKLCFIGHSHVPVVFSKSDFYRQFDLVLEDKQRYLVNVGSVGQPRDGDPRSCFVVYDDEAHSIEYIRLDYDIRKTYEKIINAGLPVFLAERLMKGY